MGQIKGKVNPSFWKNKRVYITGISGFKGSWMSLWLDSMGAIVKGYSLKPNTNPNLFSKISFSANVVSEIGDIRDLDQISQSMSDFNPDILIHMAAQPLVRLSYEDPVDTYSTNVIGTVNTLEAARKSKSLKAIVSITTDKCYENREWHWGYRESDPMGGHDPYSSSKGCAELVISAYRRSFFSSTNTASLASARAGNVIGGGDWSDDRLIPDILNAFEKSEPVTIRNPNSTRPWQHVLEPISGYLLLAENLYNHGNSFAEGWNFGPKNEGCKSVEWILEKMVANWGDGASWKIDEQNNPHEANFLKLDCSKAANRLKWEPKWTLEETLQMITDWHYNYLNGNDIKLECLKEIEKYTS